VKRKPGISIQKKGGKRMRDDARKECQLILPWEMQAQSWFLKGRGGMKLRICRSIVTAVANRKPPRVGRRKGRLTAVN